MTPRDMYNQYLVPSLKDCEADRGAVHRAVSALCHIDALAEEVWQAAKPKPTKKHWQFRAALRRRCDELGYAWDIHDIHKHGMLDRPTRVLPNGRRPTVVYIGGAFSAGFSPGIPNRNSRSDHNAGRRDDGQSSRCHSNVRSMVGY